MRVTIPHRFPKILGHNFVKQNQNWIDKKIKQIHQTPRIILKGTTVEYKKHKESALKLAQARIQHFNLHYKLSYNMIRIKNTKRIWGSCSKKGNLNFNYKIALIPADLSDYIFVHELCHLKEFNHSKKFWDLVAENIPQYKQTRATLRKL